MLLLREWYLWADWCPTRDSEIFTQQTLAKYQQCPLYTRYLVTKRVCGWVRVYRLGYYKVKECVLGTRTILNVISSTTKNKSTQKMINATSEPAVLQRCLGSAKDRAEGISQAPALMSPHCSNSVSGKNLHWMEETCSSPVCVGRSLRSSLKCGQDLSLLTVVMMAEHLWWVFCLLGLKWLWVSRRPRKRLPTVDSCNYWDICVFEGLSPVPVGKL